MKDLFSTSNGRGGGGRLSQDKAATVQPASAGDGCRLVKYAEAKKLPVEFLRGLGLTDISYLGKPAIRIPYFDAGGAEAAIRFRLALAKSEEGDNRFRWKQGAKPCLYGLWRLEAVRKAGYVIAVEGESDCHTGWFYNFPVVGIPGASNWKEERDAPHFDGIPIIYFIIEPDRGGEAVKSWLSRSRIRDRVRLIELQGFKDLSALHCADPNTFSDRLREALETATPWSNVAQAEAETEAREAWKTCETLANDPDILERFAGVLRRCGVAGETRGTP